MKGINLLIILILALALTVLAQYSANAAETNQAPVIAYALHTTDDFENGVIDTQEWEVVHNSSIGPDAIEQNGVIRLWDGGDLATRKDFWPTPEQPLRVSGRWIKPRGATQEICMFLRSTGYQLASPSSPLTGVWDGIRVRISAFSSPVSNVLYAEISRFSYDGNLNLQTPPSTGLTQFFSARSENLDFEIIDDGTNISLTVTSVDNPNVSDSLTYTDNQHPGTTSRVVFSSATISSFAYWPTPRADSFQEIGLEDVAIEGDSNASVQLLEDTTTQIGGFFVSDPDALDADIQATLSVDHGGLNLVESAWQSMLAVQPNNLVLTGTQQEITSDLAAGVRYTPNANFFGDDTLTITVNDLGQTGAGGAQETSLSVPIVVTSVNDVPVTTDDAYEVAEHGHLEIDAANGILANDLDADNEPLTIELLTTPQFGTLEINPDGSFTYRNWGEEETTDSFTYRLFDGEAHSLPASVAINILPINDALRLAFEAGRALSFDGISEAVRIDNPPAMDGSFTVEFRARHTPDSFDWVFGRGVRGSNKNLIIGFRQDSTFTMAFHPNNLDTPQPYPDTDWHHWATVYDFDASTGLGSRAIYRDGELIAQDHGVAPVAATGPIYLGTWSETGFEYAGDLDEVRIWSIARTQVEIQQDMESPIVGIRYGLEALYSFDETGNIASDTSGNERHGDLLHAHADDSRLNFGNRTIQDLPGVVTIPLNGQGDETVDLLVSSLPANGDLFQYVGASAELTAAIQSSDLPLRISDGSGRLVYKPANGYTGLDSFTVTTEDGVSQSGPFTVFVDVVAQSPTDVLHLGDSGAGSLRAAIEFVNANPSANSVIDLSLINGTIELQSTLPSLTGTVSIQGPGWRNLTIRRAGTASAFRILAIDPGADVRLSGVTLSNGKANWGGGVLNEGRFELIDSRVTDNEVYGDSGSSQGKAALGGGLYNSGDSMVIRNSVIDNNFAQGGHGTTCIGCSGGGGGGGAAGGGVFSEHGVVEIVNSTVTRNFVTGGTGASGKEQCCIVNRNNGGGGRSLLETNFAGGGTANNGGLLGGGGGGGFIASKTVGLPGTGGLLGGAGGVADPGNVVIGGGTVNGGGGGGGGGAGAGIFLIDSVARILNSTIAYNQSRSGNGGGGSGYGSAGGGAGSSAGGGIYAINGSMDFSNTLLVGNTAAIGPDVGGSTPVTSNQHNLVGSVEASVTGFDSGEFFAGAPATLLDSGLSGFGTLPLVPNGAAIDAGRNDSMDPGLTEDQRGFERILDGNSDGTTVVDIGAHEFAGVAITVKDSAGNTLAPGSTFHFPRMGVVSEVSETFTIMNDSNSLRSVELNIDRSALGSSPFLYVQDIGTSRLQPGESASFGIRISANPAAVYSSEISIPHSGDRNNPFRLALNAEVEAPDLDVSVDGASIESGASTEIDFGARESVDHVMNKSFTIQNNSLSPLAVSNLTLPDGFVLMGSFPSEVPPLQSAQFTIQFDAATHGVYSGELSFDTNDPDESVYRISIVGTVTAPSMEVWLGDANISDGTASQIDFGRHDIGNPGANKIITIKNTDNFWSLSLTNLSLPTGFSLVGSLPSEVAPLQSEALTVQFNASTPAIYAGAIAFETNDPNQPAYEISVIGSIGAATIIVSNLAEQGPGSLREAIEHGVARGGTVTFDPSLNGEHIRLTAPIELIRDVTIDGSGVDLSLSNTAGGSVFRTERETVVELNSLKLLVESTAADGLIYNTGRLIVKNSTIKGHPSYEAPGIGNIGIFIDETQERRFAHLRVEDTLIETTQAGIWPGGGIWGRTSDIDLVNVTIRDCRSRYEGGGIYHRLGTLTMQGCLIEGNTAEGSQANGGGGGIYAEGTTDSETDANIYVNISSSTTIRNNNASRGGGIAIINGRLEASGLEVSGNSAGTGAGLFVNAPKHTAKLDGCSIRDNRIKDGGAAQGAGIYCRGSLDIQRSTISGNRSSGLVNAQGGGIYVDVPSGEFRLRESTLSGNEAHRATSGQLDYGDTSGGSNARGAALFLTSSSQENPCVIQNCTIVGNDASIISDPGAIPADRFAGGVYLDGWTSLTVSGSIIAGNSSPSEFRDVSAGPNAQFVGNRYNLIGDPVPAVGFDFTGTDSSFAALGISTLAEVLELSLQDNGGATPTHRLVSGSPAIDAGNPQTAIAANDWDQRGTGYRRVNDGLGTGTARIDIGAVEYPHTEPTIIESPAAEVVGRHIFYNHSAWDGNTAGSNGLDDNAIAIDKSALLPGQIATFSNYTSYSLGINGILIDIANLAGTPSAADFTFKVGNNNDPNGWSAAPVPTEIAIRSGAGVNGSDRVTLIWSNNAIQKQWLQVTVLATTATGLTTPDVFYFGNAIGECGNATSNAFVDVSDENASRQNPRNFLNLGPVTDRYDYNRDRKVDISDQNIARNHNTNFLTALKLIDLTGQTPPSGAFRTRSVKHHSLTTPETNDPADTTGTPAPYLSIDPLADGWLVITAENVGTGDYILQTTDDVQTPQWETVRINPSRDPNTGMLQWLINSQEGQATGFFQVIQAPATPTSNR